MGFFSRKTLASDVEVVKLLRQMHIKQGELEGEIEKLKAGHQSLRGFVYARVRKAAEPEPDTEPQDDPTDAAPAVTSNGHFSPTLTKAELRRALTTSGRFVPGKPARHE